MAFYFDKETLENKESYLLGYQKEQEGEHTLLLKVSPELGNNIYCFRVDDYEVIHYDTYFSLLSYYTGNPILYPFPNRLRNCFYEYDGKQHWQQKNGIPVFMHSLVYDESWKHGEPVISSDSVTLKTWLNIDEKHPVFEGFPFVHTLTITFELTKLGFSIVYGIENKGTERLPYGISYHTFFNKLCGDAGSFIRVPAKYMMELTDDLLPTGKLLEVEGQPFDLREPVPSGKLNLDNCFTGMIEGQRVFVDYPALGLRIYMDATEDFTHMQIFTPKQKPFFCVEKQTCSTDAVNLDAKNFKQEAHLLSVLPGETKTGRVSFSYAFKKNN
ncbi:aldose 1-epimerase [uncultured Sphaerochaeta sp.]|uniref:aldose 1-epimerase n=1 Tax=uncultured Sphaerochaeta sp. TaxID=886478 RepID=UPI002A0A827E|nr:aldose 1-epimerase [uncultured Sphaerochaeta sp.]